MRLFELIRAFLLNRSLLNAAKGLYFIFTAFSSISNNLRGFKKNIRKNARIIVKTICIATSLMGLKHACKLFKISIRQFYTWKRKIYCRIPPLEECFKQHAKSLSEKKIHTIKRCIRDEQYRNDTLISIYYNMMRHGKAFMSLITFYKYAKLFDIYSDRKFRNPKQKIGIRASKPRGVIHAYVSVYRPARLFKNIYLFYYR